MNEELKHSASIALRDCLALKAGETFLVITDEAKREIGYAFFEVGKEMGAEVVLMEMLPRHVNGEEPPEVVAKAWLAADVFVCPTSKSLTHTRARENAVKLGARGATLPDVNAEMMKRCIPVDYHKMEARCAKLVEALNNGKHVRVTTDLGTDIQFSIEGRNGAPDTGIYNQPGTFGNLPAGEAYIAPLEYTAEGTIVVDGAMMTGIVDKPITLKVEKGFVTEITGGESAKALLKEVEAIGHNARNIAEFGIGINENAIFTGNVLEDEKIDNTIHLAIGNNAHFGGVIDVPFHQDGIITKPTVYIDGNIVIKEGVHLL
jgi:leucyl aminopeptidase (aminopeptidase T)